MSNQTGIANPGIQDRQNYVAAAVSSATLADNNATNILCIAAEERLLALIHNTELLALLGKSVSLLSHIIIACAANDSCMINLHEAAQKIGQPYSTIKTWMAGLEAAGLIWKTVHGRDGVRVELDTNRVHRAPMFKQIVGRLDEAAEALRAAQVTLGNVLAHAETGVRKELEVLA